MKYFKIAFFVSALLCFKNSGAQELDTIPPELIGNWLITDVYATDLSMVTDTDESNALMEDLVVANSVVYEFSLTTFTLKINGQTIGSCGYVLDIESNFIFDEDGEDFTEIVNDLIGVNLTPTELKLEVSPPDGESNLTFHKTLIKQP